MIGIVDLDMGNLRSVSNAVHSLGFDPFILRDAASITKATHLILPGVGAYAEAARRLDELGLKEPIRRWAKDGRPLLGICLGMEILSDSGDEGGPAEGLGLIPGKIVRMEPGDGLAVPHVGWNTIDFTGGHPVFADLKSGVDFYFVHSYQYDASDPAVVVGSTDYGRRFPSIVAKGSVVGFQFHPEKSQANGLKLLENFCGWNGKC